MKRAIPHLVATAIFLAITIFFSLPAFQGKQIVQQDNVQASGAAREVTDYFKETGKAALWTNTMFSGMPAYQIWVAYPTDAMTGLHRFLKRWTPEPANKIFLFLIMSYVFLIVLGLDQRISIVGAIALSFPSYNFIFIEAGHSTKAMAIGYMFGALAGIILTYRGKLLMGAVVTAFFMTLELKSNHFQITYYLLMMSAGLFIAYLVQALKEEKLPQFIKASILIGAASLIGLGNNAPHLWTTYEYSKHTIRGGKSELSSNQKENTGGLDKDYALAWSYGKMETMTLLVPNFAGGSSGESPMFNDGSQNEDSEALKFLQSGQVDQNQANQLAQRVRSYWGPMPFTSGPAYMGAIICFLFVLGLVIVKGPLKGWIIAVTVVSILLAWGKNLEWFTDIFFYYVPFYNKFRAVSTTLVMTQVAMPLMAMMALHQMLKGVDQEDLMKGLKYAAGVTGGLCLLLLVMPTLFGDFLNDQEYALPSGFKNALAADRISIMKSDAIRSLIFILLAAGAIWMYMKEKLKGPVLIAVIGVLILVDMWGVNKRYLNEGSFGDVTSNEQLVPPTRADQQITQDPDPHFRVFNQAVNTFNDATTSYHHKSIGGYHAAKLRRYQEVIEKHLTPGNMNVFNMLNAKYFIQQAEDGQPIARSNPGALGHGWFVQEIKMVNNADEEIEALTGFDAAKTAIIDKRFESAVTGFSPAFDAAGTITLTDYDPDRLTYKSSATSDQLAVFSDIYYADGWQATVDGNPVDHFRVNYVLRGMIVPAGDHEIVFEFRPSSYYTGVTLSWIFQIILLIGIGFVVYTDLIKKKDEEAG
jgi:hypothetical protein